MSSYPEDLIHLDQEFGKTGQLRELAGQVWAVNAWVGGDLYDIIEDWPDVPQLTGVEPAEIPGLRLPLADVDEPTRMRLHIGFGGTEDDVLALRAKGTRYTMERNA